MKLGISAHRGYNEPWEKPLFGFSLFAFGCRRMGLEMTL